MSRCERIMTMTRKPLDLQAQASVELDKETTSRMLQRAAKRTTRTGKPVAMARSVRGCHA